MATKKYLDLAGLTYYDGKKQDKLVSGTNIKTINNQSILGAGNLTISGGSGTIDTALSATSENAVQNKAIYAGILPKLEPVPVASEADLPATGEAGKVYLVPDTGADTSIMTLMNIFYPVGTYYETSDTSFDPNVVWGGTWVEDTAGRVTVAQTTSGSFDTINATGGLERTNHVYYRAPINSHNAQNANSAYSEYVNNRVGSWLTAGGSSGLALDMVVASVAGNVAADAETRNPTEAGYFRYTSTNLQPYKVVKRWHRTA